MAQHVEFTKNKLQMTASLSRSGYDHTYNPQMIVKPPALGVHLQTIKHLMRFTALRLCCSAIQRCCVISSCEPLWNENPGNQTWHQQPAATCTLVDCGSPAPPSLHCTKSSGMCGMRMVCPLVGLMWA